MKSFDLGSNGPHLHFLHANGYPPACYQPLLELLQSRYHVFGMLLRPLWPDSNPKEIQDWHPFSDDLLRFLAGQPTPVIGVGHSIGAVVTLRAALRDPGKFRALVLIDPVLFVPSFLFMWKLIRTLGLGDGLLPLIARAKKRRRTFDDLETVYRGYRSRSIFRFMSDENLRIYIEGMTRKTDRGREHCPNGRQSPQGGYELVYSPEWEAHLYLTALRDFDIWRDLPTLQVPTLFLRGAETDSFPKNAAQLVKRKRSRAWVETLDRSTHLLPLERPGEVFDRMQTFLREVL